MVANLSVGGLVAHAGFGPSVGVVSCVAPPPVWDLSFRAKHLFVAAGGWNRIAREASVGGTARRRRRPTLSALLRAAEKAGKAVKSATIEDGKVTLVFGSGESAASSNDDWDKKLEELERGKH